MNRTAVLSVVAATAVFVGTGVAYAQDETPTPLEQLCAATDLAAVSDVLDGFTTETLPAELGGLIAVVEADDEGVIRLRADVTDLAAVQAAAGCETDPVDPTPDPVETTTPTSTTPTPEPVDRDCASFASQAEAQAYYESRRTTEVPDPVRLDANGNGVACEQPDVAAETPQTSTTASTTDTSIGGDGFNQIDQVPSLPAQTGGGPA